MPPGNRNDPQRCKSSESRYSLVEFMRDFPDDAACLEWLWQTRCVNEDGTTWCPKCETNRHFTRYSMAQQRQSWTCTACGHHVHPTAGTIFHKSSTSLHLWFYAMYLMTSTRCGISAKQLERELGVTYKTAWRMCNLIRKELMYQDDGDTLSGEVEMDETYVGGRRREWGGRSRVNEHMVADKPKRGAGGRPPADHPTKRPVFGMVERGGNVRAWHVEDVKSTTLLPKVLKNVEPGSVVYTDEYQSYRPLARNGYEHKTIRHNDHVYVNGDVHTQTIEGFWSQVKRSISGTHHWCSAKHLQGYLNEYVFRYNNRERDDEDGTERPALFALLILRAASTRV